MGICVCAGAVKAPRANVAAIGDNNSLLFIWPNKKISVFWLTALEILGRVGSHIFFSGKKI